MLMPKKNRNIIYEHLFKEGVMVAFKDYHAHTNLELEIPNLEVIKTLKSLKSRGFVKEQFAWRHFYWFVTNEGIDYLRSYLHLPPEIVPSTLKRQTRATVTTTVRPRPVAEPAKREPWRSSEDRNEYRRAPGEASDKKASVGQGTGEIEFRGGFGRGNNDRYSKY